MEAWYIPEDRFISRRLGENGLTPGRPILDAAPDVSRIEEIDCPARLDLEGISLTLFIKTELMKQYIFCLIALPFTAAAGSTIKVAADLDKTVDFTGYKTYSYPGWEGM